MEHRQLLQDSIEYIETNLQAELTATELAQRAGFSLYYYYRLFQTATGMPVMRYILRRRLLHAIWEIQCGSNGIDAALRYGFDTYAGFYRAFLREFGSTPSRFLQQGRAKRPYRPTMTEEERMTHSKAKIILRHWGLQDLEITDLYYEGSGNRSERTYAVGSDWILKFNADSGKMQKQLELSRLLATAGIAVASVVPTMDGREWVQEEGVSVWLTRRLMGQPLRAKDFFHEKGLLLAERMGEQIGRLHQAMEHMEADVDEVDLFAAVRDWALPTAQPMLRLSMENACGYLAEFAALQDQLPRQLIHRDLNPGNMLQTEKGWGFLDFELSERNLRIYDPCYAATAILSECFGIPLEQES